LILAIGGVLANALGQADGSKTTLKIYMDLVRVNVVQATPGDEAVFNLRLNKMLPTPCLTIATIRYERVLWYIQQRCVPVMCVYVYVCVRVMCVCFLLLVVKKH